MGASTKTEPKVSKTEIGLHLSTDKLTLFLKFKKKAGMDILVCLKLLENILLLSNAYREFLATHDKAAKKFNKTKRIREDIQSLVNREGVSDDNVTELITLIRQGAIEEIRTSLAGENLTVAVNTDFTNLFVELNKPQAKN